MAKVNLVPLSKILDTPVDEPGVHRRLLAGLNSIADRAVSPVVITRTPTSWGCRLLVSAGAERVSTRQVRGWIDVPVVRRRSGALEVVPFEAGAPRASMCLDVASANVEGDITTFEGMVVNGPTCVYVAPLAAVRVLRKWQSYPEPVGYLRAGSPEPCVFQEEEFERLEEVSFRPTLHGVSTVVDGWTPTGHLKITHGGEVVVNEDFEEWIEVRPGGRTGTARVEVTLEPAETVRTAADEPNCHEVDTVRGAILDLLERIVTRAAVAALVG